MPARGILVLLIIVVVLGCVTALLTSRFTSDEAAEKPNPSGAMKALNFWAAQRAYPNRVIPDIGQALAFEQTRQLRQAASPTGIDDLVAPWETLGPANIGGRTLSLALHPNDPDIIFAGSASGGLWKSTTGGIGAVAWEYVDTGYAILGVSTIAIDTADPDVMYIGTGEVYRYQDSTGGEVIRTTRGSYGMGILKTTDGGGTWTKSLDWTYAQTRGIWMVKIHPTNSSIVYAATTEGVYKSTDAGGSWSQVHDVIMATDLHIHPVDHNLLFVACGNFGSADHGIYRSTDAGANWTKLASGLPSTYSGKTLLDIAPSDPDVIYASIANEQQGRGLYRSVDLGNNWTQVSGVDYPRYQGWYSHYVIVSPNDPDYLFVGGIEIWRSTNGGSSLSQRSNWPDVFFGSPPPEGPSGGPQYAHADHHFAIWHPTDPDIIFFASDGGVFRSINGGDTFESLNGHYLTSQFYNGFANSGTNPDRAIGGMQDNFTAIYEGNVAWNRVIGGDGAWGAIHPLNDQTLYGSYQYLGMLRSRNGGVDWTGIEPPEAGTDQTAFIAPYVLAPSFPTVLYAARSRVYKSIDEGTTWTATNAGNALDGFNPALSMAISAFDPNVVYVGTAPIFSRARVFRTLNGGTDWTDITGPLPDRYPSDIAVDRNDDSVVYVTFMGFGTPHVFKSITGGDTWTDITANLPDIPTSAVEVDPDYPEVIYVGTDLGAYISINGGGSWEPFMNGMPPAMVNDLKVFWPGRVLRAATHGNAVFERSLYDPTVGVADGAPAPPVSAVALSVQPNPLRAESRVTFRLPEADRARVSVFDVNGRSVAVLLDERLGAGEHEVPIELKGLTPGVYFLRLEAGAEVAVSRVVYLR